MFFENLESRHMFSGTSITPEPPRPPMPPLPVSDAHLPPPTKKTYAGDDADRTPPRETPHGPFELPCDRITHYRPPGR